MKSQIVASNIPPIGGILEIEQNKEFKQWQRITTMADNKNKKVLKSSIEREQSQTCLNSAEREKIKGSTNLNVPHLRFPEFSGEWKKYKLSEVCSFFSGGTPSSSKKEYYGGSIPFIRSGEIHVNKTELFITEEGLNNSAAKKVVIGDLLLALYGATSGDIAISQINGAINQAILCIRTTQNKKFVESVWKKHVNKLLQTYLQGGQGNLSADIVKNISFYLTSNIEQNKLARFVSLLDERIATQNKIIDKWQSLIKGISNRIFASIQGIEYRMGDIVTITNGNSNVQDAVTQSKDGLYPFFDRSEDIKYLPTFLFDKEAIIYPGKGTDFMPRYFKGKFALHQRCYAIFDFNEFINARFLYFYLKTRNSYFVKNAVGSTVPSLRLDTFQKLKVIIPSKKAQHSVSSCLSSMEQKCNVEKKILYKLLNQKQYLLRQMFI